MKNIKVIIAFVLGILVSGLGVYALNINARDTAYDNTNSGSSATNMQDAIDDLYEKSGNGAELISLGSYNVVNTNIDVSNFYDGDLTKLTSNNFWFDNVVAASGISGRGGTNISVIMPSPLTKTYNPETGILRVTSSTGMYDTGAGAGTNRTVMSVGINSYSVYLITGIK